MIPRTDGPSRADDLPRPGSPFRRDSAPRSDRSPRLDGPPRPGGLPQPEGLPRAGRPPAGPQTAVIPRAALTPPRTPPAEVGHAPTSPARLQPAPPPQDDSTQAIPAPVSGGGGSTAPPSTTPPPAAPPSAGANRFDPHRRAKRWYIALAATVGVLTLLASCGTFTYQLVQDELAGRQAQADVPAEEAEPVPRDISSREADPEPLTVDEVFPDDEIVINPAEPPYEVLETQASDDCTVAAADGLGVLLQEKGCDQVVRATLRSPTEAFLITGGIFNLDTEAEAEEVYDSVGPMIDDESGRFLGLLAGEGTEPIVLSETRVGWDFRGHYLIYVVIARADGEPFASADDRHAELILWDIVEVHLRTSVLDGRTVGEPPEDLAADESAATSAPESDV